MSDAPQTLSVVVPVFDEVLVVQRFHRRLRGVLDGIEGLATEVIYIDDGSSDGSFEALRDLAASDPTVSVVRLSRNFGHQAALTAGLDLADGDAVVTLDADLQMPPETIPELVARWRDGAEIVQGIRRDGAVTAPFKRWTATGFYRLINLLSEVPIEANAPDFRLLDRRPLEVLRGMREHHRFIRGMVRLIGYRTETVPFDIAPRTAGTSKFALSKMLAFALDAVVSFSIVPIRVSIVAGLAMASIGVVYAVYVVWIRFGLGIAVPGWASTTIAVLALGGMNLTMLGVTGEYVARIYEEVKGRPLYVVREQVGRQQREI